MQQETEFAELISNMNNPITKNDKLQLKKITDNLNKRMINYHSSLEPTDDEITIAWLLTVVSKLQKLVSK